MFRSLSCLFVVPLSSFVLGCSTPQEVIPGVFPPGGEALATVNGKRITKDMVDAVLRVLPAQIKDQVMKNGDTSSIVESLVTSEVLYQEALARGLHKDPLVVDDLALAERNALTEALLRTIVEQRMTDDRIKQWYDEHLVQFSQPQVRLAHIVVTDKALADSIAERARKGEDFAALARDNSLDSSTSSKGGDIGWLSLDQVVDDLRTLLQNAEKGGILGPMEMGKAFHVFKALDKRETQPLEEVRDQIVETLEQDIRTEYVDELREKAAVVQMGGEGTASDAKGAPAEGAPAKAAPAEGAPAKAAPTAQ